MSKHPAGAWPKPQKGWRSGFCNRRNPADSHARCAGELTSEIPCVCDCHTPQTTSPGSSAPTLDEPPALTRRDRLAESGTGTDPGEVPTTPTGVLVYEGKPVTPEWFAARREGITGTDLPKILGLTKYGNALSVWKNKRGELDDDAGEAAHWGNLLEDVVAQEWARRNETGVTTVGVLAKVDERWKRASLDRLTTRCPDGDPGMRPNQECGLEIKTRSAFKAGSFRDDVPDDVLAQVSWGLHVTGLDHMHVAVLIGGQQLLQFRVDRDDQLEQYLSDAAAPVWQAVQNGLPPEAHPDSEGVLLALLNQIYEQRAGERDLDVERAEPWLAQYAEGAAFEKRGKAMKTEAKTGLVQLLGDGDTGLIDGAPAFTYKTPGPSDSLPAKELKRLREESPEIYEALQAEGYITTTEPAPRFNLTGAWKDSK